MIENNEDESNNIPKINRKAEKKHKRCQHNLERQTGAVYSSQPTTSIAICNAGLSNGLSEEDVAQNFYAYGTLKQVIGVPGKSFSFVEYNDLSSSIKAFAAINGKLHIAQGNKPLYLAFVESIPNEYTMKKEYHHPPGLIILYDFITAQEELELLSMHNFESDNTESGALKHRQVKHYGYEFCYDINNVKKDSPLDQPIPSKVDFLWDRLKSSQGIEFYPDQLTINFYKPGNGIPAHVDTHSAFEDPLVCLSLGSGIMMEFKHEDGRHLAVYLPARSLTVMSDESRYAWTHKIVPRKLDVVPSEMGVAVIPRKNRTSFTFRKVLQDECNCQYKSKCDSYIRSKMTPPSVDNKLAAKLEETHVHEVYENIAQHFSDTRHKPWPNVLDFVNSFPTGSMLLDVGCGNGKYFGFNKNIYEIGCDRSFNLAEVCNTRGFQIFTCNCLHIPINDEMVDGVISIAVIHHMATEERRIKAIREIARVLRGGGTALIYVWAKDQCKEQKSTYIKQDRKNRKSDADVSAKVNKEVSLNGFNLPVHTNRTQFQHQDMLVPWKKKKDDAEDVLLRFYHVFEEGELENLCSNEGNIKVIKSYYDQGNWCVIFKKCL